MNKRVYSYFLIYISFIFQAINILFNIIIIVRYRILFHAKVLFRLILKQVGLVFNDNLIMITLLIAVLYLMFLQKIFFHPTDVADRIQKKRTPSYLYHQELILIQPFKFVLPNIVYQ